MSFRHRLEKVREALVRGPKDLSVAQWVEEAGVTRIMVQPSYSSKISLENQEALAAAAAKVLGWDPGQMEAWLLHGQEVPDLEEFLARLPTLARCAGCLDWFPKKKVLRSISRCKDCNRQLKRSQRNPQADRLFDVAQQQLPQIRAVNPEFAIALEACLGDKSRALTTARIQRCINTARAACGAMALSRLRADALMEEFGLKAARPTVLSTTPVSR